MKQTSDGMADDGAAMQRNVMDGLRNGQEVVVERRNRPDHHATADNSIRRALFDGESGREEWHRIEGEVRHGGGGADGEQLR